MKPEHREWKVKPHLFVEKPGNPKFCVECGKLKVASAHGAITTEMGPYALGHMITQKAPDPDKL